MSDHGRGAPSTKGYEIEPAKRGPRKPCVIDGCDTPQKGRGWCPKHYARWFRNGGDPRVALKVFPGPGEPIGYFPAHQNVKKLHGRAAQHPCAHCSKRADQWAYDNADPDEIVDGDGRRYSLNVDHYFPLCTQCHADFDADYRKRNGILTRQRRGREAPCGTRCAYTKWGCRCEPCTAAAREYRLARTAAGLDKRTPRKPTDEQRIRINELQNARRRRLKEDQS